jgi:4-hydroxy-tetrahydrodipicolinate synthase
VPADVAAHLRERFGPIVAGVKDSSGDFAHFRAFRQAAPELAIAVGIETHIRRALAEGGAGTICGLGNVAPALIRSIFTQSPAPAQELLESLYKQLDGPPYEPTLKAVLAAQTGEPSWLRVRAPLRAAPAADGERIANWLSTCRMPDGRPVTAG